MEQTGTVLFSFLGWMHSGYPIMGPIEALTSSNLLNATALRNKGTWGAFHEFGHNMQWSRYTVGGTTETGCNWWSIVMNEVCIKNIIKSWLFFN